VPLAGGTGFDGASAAALAPFLERCPKQLPRNVIDALRASRPRGVALPKYDRARVCGIPAAKSKSKPSSTNEVVGTPPPRGVSLTQIKSATRADVERVQAQVARCYRRAGKRLGPPDDSRIQSATDALLRNQRVRDVAQRLRTNALAERTDTRRLADADLALDALVPRSYRRLISDFARDADLAVPTRRIACTDSPPPVVKPDATIPVEVGWIELHSATKGDDATYDHDVRGSGTNELAYVHTTADVGWDSESTSTAIIQGVIVVPEGTRKVTLRTTYLPAEWSDYSWGTWGDSCAYRFAHFGAFKINGGFTATFVGAHLDVCPLPSVFPDENAPVPDAPVLTATERRRDTMVNPPPGVYSVWIEVGARAWSEGMASAYADHFFWLREWTATFEFD
jgi:hypothetical protein